MQLTIQVLHNNQASSEGQLELSPHITHSRIVHLLDYGLQLINIGPEIGYQIREICRQDRFTNAEFWTKSLIGDGNPYPEEAYRWNSTGVISCLIMPQPLIALSHTSELFHPPSAQLIKFILELGLRSANT